MGAKLSKRGSYDFTSSQRLKNYIKSDSDVENVCTNLTTEEIYEDMTKITSPILSIKEFDVGNTNEALKTQTETEEDCQSSEEDFKSPVEHSPKIIRQHCSIASTLNYSKSTTKYDWNDAFKEDFWKNKPSTNSDQHYNDSDIKLSNEYSNVITADSIERLRETLLKKESSVINTRQLLNIAEQEEEEEEEYFYCKTHEIECQEKKDSSRKVSFTSKAEEESDNEIEDQFYDAVAEITLKTQEKETENEVKIRENINHCGVDENNTVLCSSEETQNLTDERKTECYEVETPDIILVSQNDKHFDYSEDDIKHNLRRCNSFDLISSSGIFPVQKTTLDLQWLSSKSLNSSRPSSLHFTKSSPNLCDYNPDEPTPEEIAEIQMRLWDQQEKTQHEAEKSEILLVTSTVKELKCKIENLSLVDQTASEMYQTLIKIMRDVNNIQTNVFNQEVLELKNSVLLEIYECLKLLQIKTSGGL